MKVLILGSGGREHALAWAVKRSPRVTEVVCAPGNGGIAQIARCVPVDLKDLDAMVRLAEAEQPGLTIVGPELPLSLGIVDALQRARPARLRPHARRRHARKQQGLRQAASCSATTFPPPTTPSAPPPPRSKRPSTSSIRPSWSRPTAWPPARASSFAPRATPPLKPPRASSPASCWASREQQIVIEEFLEGDEISFLCLSDGKHVTPLVPAQDHKRIGEGDTGPNTGGMGVYSTDTLLDPAMTEWILHHIAEPTIRGMAEEGTPFIGVLYCGLMMTARGPQVLEFNARFGDPETQAILLRLEIRSGRRPGSLRRRPARRDRTPLVARRLSLRRGQFRRLSGQLQNRLSHHRPQCRRPGSRRPGLSRRHRTGGRPTAHRGRPRPGRTAAAAPSLEEALARAYQAMAEIQFEGMYYRRDIGHRALKRKS